MKENTMTHDESINFLIDMIPTVDLTFKDGKVTQVKAKGFSLREYYDVHMKVDVLTKEVRIRQVDAIARDELTFLYHVEDVIDAYRIWQAYTLPVNEFAQANGYMICQNEGPWGNWEVYRDRKLVIKGCDDDVRNKILLDRP